MTRYTPLWLQSGSYAASVDRRLMGALWPAAASVGCLCSVAGSTMNININQGSVAVPSQNNTGTTLCVSDATEQVTITPAPPSGQNRIDLVTCHPRGNDLDGGSNTDFIFDVVTGTAATTPTVPATPAGQVALYQVTVPGGAANLVTGNLTDVRPGGLAVPPASGAGAPSLGYIIGGTNPSTVNAGATMTTVMSLTFPVVAGRRYRIDAVLNGNQQTATGLAQGQIVDDQGGSFVFGSQPGLTAGSNIVRVGYYFFKATTTRNATISLQANTSAGTLQCSAGWSRMDASDAGAN
jgi:hypothetical protein